MWVYNYTSVCLYDPRLMVMLYNVMWHRVSLVRQVECRVWRSLWLFSTTCVRRHLTLWVSLLSLSISLSLSQHTYVHTPTHQMAISDHITDSAEKSSLLRKEQRMREREKSKDISDNLKQLCERQRCSLDEVEAKRKEFTTELCEMRKRAEVRTWGWSSHNTL